jgi:hypothetical protein
MKLQWFRNLSTEGRQSIIDCFLSNSTLTLFDSNVRIEASGTTSDERQPLSEFRKQNDQHAIYDGKEWIEWLKCRVLEEGMNNRNSDEFRVNIVLPSVKETEHGREFLKPKQGSHASRIFAKFTSQDIQWTLECLPGNPSKADRSIRYPLHLLVFQKKIS